MATSDGRHKQHDRYRYKKPHEVKVHYNSDDEQGRRQRRREPPHSYFARVPSPPRLNRNRSTSSDNRHNKSERREPKFERADNIEETKYLSPSQPYRLKHNGASSPTTGLPFPPKIVVSEDARRPNSPSRHTYRSQEWHAPATDHVQQSLQYSRSSSGSLGHDIYQYRGLGLFEFRLVRLFAKRMSAIKCEIIHFSLTDPPPYTGISYAWGDADDKRSIQISNLNIPVAVSLFGALDAVRRTDSDVLIWVDALCIDQQNRDERSEQVQLMTQIYAKAENVAIWLGPSTDSSELAIEFLQEIFSARDDDSKKITALLSSSNRLRAVASLFQRDYWKRLWVTQEVFNAGAITVYCGNSAGVPWSVYDTAACIFQEHKKDLDSYFSISTTPRNHRLSGMQQSFSYSQALVYEGPNSLCGFGSLDGLGEESLLIVMRACRRKLTNEPRDKVYGILGVLPDSVRKEFPVNYNRSIKDIYTTVVDFLLHTTGRMDVVCESIHFPKRTSGVQLPSWVPDWSQNPEITALGYSYGFCAAGETRGNYYQFDECRNELEISAMLIDIVQVHGVAVGTHCTLADYLMAFLHWRAILMDSMSSQTDELRKSMEEKFCKTLCLGQVPPSTDDSSRVYSPSEWKRLCYNAFAAHFHSRLPYVRLDDDLIKYINIGLDDKPNLRQFLQDNFGSRMMGRCFFVTETNRMGMGTGAMLPGDIIVVPLGCRTPIIIRKANQQGRFQYVGDVYLDGYMYGKAVDHLNHGDRKIEKFVLI
ncbi:heterokaryon incompatibility protein-domain-containing protein [Nemania sp. FL0031]|nr:heterokaryon incompatibility protein-domain-containing protein [Nemania sp. FL0031]